MKLIEIRCRDDRTGERIQEVHVVLADDENPDSRTEWLDAQLAVDVPIAGNGALLRAHALMQVIDRLRDLVRHYERVGKETR